MLFSTKNENFEPFLNSILFEEKEIAEKKQSSDQIKIDKGEMSWQRYMKKWHNTDIEYSVMPSSN
jgi:hypothetical protein